MLRKSCWLGMSPRRLSLGQIEVLGPVPQALVGRSMMETEAQVETRGPPGLSGPVGDRVAHRVSIVR